MYLGIDLGTSGVKAIVMNDQGQVIASETASLEVSRPNPLWSEQNPELWWQATDHVVHALGQKIALDHVKAIGLSGQMHGATLLDAKQRILRPAILWNDGRSAAECVELEQRVPNSRHITGNLMMPGFTAPKLLWVAKNEPELFAQIDKVLLPKDYLRWRMSGDFATDLSDAAGTLWLDVQKRDWNDELLTTTGLCRAQMPILLEGNQISGYLNREQARHWSMNPVPIIGGGGDNAAGAVGVGLYEPGQAMLSLGTSGVYFIVSDGFLSAPEQAVHSFCHALPERWHLMSVMLSAASCLDWVANLTGLPSVAALFAEIETSPPASTPPYFLPYLSGERTPHNNPHAKGSFFNLTHEHQRADLCRAVLEGVSFALADGMTAVHACGIKPTQVTLIGGGARSPYWRQMLADISGMTMEYRVGGDVGPALGAARLAQMSCQPERHVEDVLPKLELSQIHVPDLKRHVEYQARHCTFRRLYQQLLPLMQGE
ncbi:xylulokinase [Aeromonas sp. MdU4]|uniref:xylulokinase n=1 Tax=Aeromonas sp. MdU4 TaxID=3342819 RepID=UPI0035B79E55